MNGIKVTLLGSLFLLGACATSSRPPISTEAVEDFIVANELEDVKAIRSGRSDSWKSLNSVYVLYEGRSDPYLVKFQRPCRNLDDVFTVDPDRRREMNAIYARFDTLRGCLIGEIFAITDVQAEELSNLGFAPGENSY